jgi:protein O-mannosyl-transferase
LLKSKKNAASSEGNHSNVIIKFFLKYKSYLFFCLAGFVLYIQSVNYTATYHDDYSLLTGNYLFLKDPGTIFKLFTQSVFSGTGQEKDFYYRPVLSLSFFTDVQVAGKSLKFSHFANIIYHLIASCVLFVFLQSFFIEKQAAFWLTLLFIIHPALVQAIAWVPGRNDSLLSIFSLLSCLSLIHFIQYENKKYLFRNIAFFGVALLTKETAVILPLLFILIIIYFQKKTNKIFKQKRILIVSWIILCLCFFAVRKLILGTSVGLPFLYVIQHFFMNIPAFILYTGKMLLPFGLSTFPILKDATLVYGLISIAILIIAFYYSKNTDYFKVFLGACWMIIFLIPAVIPTTNAYETSFLEHRMYLPMIGFLLLISETDAIKRINFQKANARILLACTAILFFCLSLKHSSDYKNEFNYFQSAVKANPHSSFALRGLGTSYLAESKYEMAKDCYLKSLNLNPGLSDVRNNLGRIYMNLNLNEKAKDLFMEEMGLFPKSAMPYYNLALLALNNNKLDTAEILIKKSIEYDPNYIEARHDLAVIKSYKGNYEEAINIYIKILEQDPDYYSAKKNINLIFSVWKDENKVNEYHQLLLRKGIRV